MASESRFAGSAGILSSTVRVSTATTPTGIPPSLIKNDLCEDPVDVIITASHLFFNPTSTPWWRGKWKQIESGKSDSSGGKILLYRFGKYGKWEERRPQSHSYSPA